MVRFGSMYYIKLFELCWPCTQYSICRYIHTCDMCHECFLAIFQLPLFFSTKLCSWVMTTWWTSISFLNKSCLRTMSLKSGSEGINLTNQWWVVWISWSIPSLLLLLILQGWHFQFKKQDLCISGTGHLKKINIFCF